MTFGIIPLDGEPTVQGTSPVCGDRVHGSNGLDYMLCILVTYILDAKVIKNKGDSGVAVAVAPESWGVRCWAVTIGCKVLGKLLIGDYTGLFQSIHSFF